ncbi:hypothetical protein FE257_006294 [Aspergillus nanangensis]|uniref:Uncharacterized protein n=1 Tax=Aspergillus nanangensis TaxID=2582783 RepID=A0AAD4CQU4_ASPNN|nr:hypothetical protein FE257_006294 [Aspergillus nanangensis]
MTLTKPIPETVRKNLPKISAAIVKRLKHKEARLGRFGAAERAEKSPKLQPLVQGHPEEAWRDSGDYSECEKRLRLVLEEELEGEEKTPRRRNELIHPAPILDSHSYLRKWLCGWFK